MLRLSCRSRNDHESESEAARGREKPQHQWGRRQRRLRSDMRGLIACVQQIEPERSLFSAASPGRDEYADRHNSEHSESHTEKQEGRKRGNLQTNENKQTKGSNLPICMGENALHVKILMPVEVCNRGDRFLRFPSQRRTSSMLKGWNSIEISFPKHTRPLLWAAHQHAIQRICEHIPKINSGFKVSTLSPHTSSLFQTHLRASCHTLHFGFIGICRCFNYHALVLKKKNTCQRFYSTFFISKPVRVVNVNRSDVGGSKFSVKCWIMYMV